MLFVVHHTDAEGADALLEVSGGNQLSRPSMLSRRDRSKNFELRIRVPKWPALEGYIPEQYPATQPAPSAHAPLS